MWDLISLEFIAQSEVHRDKLGILFSGLNQGERYSQSSKRQAAPQGCSLPIFLPLLLILVDYVEPHGVCASMSMYPTSYRGKMLRNVVSVLKMASFLVIIP